MSRASRIVAKVDALRYTVRVLLYCSNAPTKTTVELELLGIVIRSGVWGLESLGSGVWSLESMPYNPESGSISQLTV